MDKKAIGLVEVEKFQFHTDHSTHTFNGRVLALISYYVEEKNLTLTFSNLTNSTVAFYLDVRFILLSIEILHFDPDLPTVINKSGCGWLSLVTP